jgi:hypothetical protein
MIIHQNSLIILDYTPASDILEVEYPDLQGYLLSHIKESLDLMVETIRTYDVKRLLIDASKTVIEISEEENKQLTIHLGAALVSTRLQKLARIQPIDLNQELRAQENIQTLKSSGLLPYQLQTFTDKNEALSWLKK